MAHVEPMDVDSMESDYEDKENSILHSNVIPKIPCTEKGYEELDASELNMKLRYSITPASSPMSRSYTANCKDNKNIEERNSSCIGNANLTSSLNSTLTNNDINNASKVYPLQTLPTENLNDMNRNVLLPKSLDKEDKNVTITVSNGLDENLSIPSTSSSITHTPEATTPTKELPKDGGSPIMRGLRSVLSMFKPQSPRPSHEQGPQEDCGPLQANNTITDESQLHPVEVSTPLRTTNRTSPKRTSPHKDSVIFNDDLEKELQWKDDSAILFKEEKIPKHKLFLQESVALNIESKILNKTKEECNRTVEYMDISYNDSVLNDKTMTDIETKPHGLEAGGLESDGEFVDCETTFTKDEIESLLKSKENISMHNSIQLTSINAEAGSSDLVKNIHPLNLTIPVETSDLVWRTSNDVNSEILATAENDNIVSNNVLKQSFLLSCNDKSELVNNSDINLLPVESSDLPVCTSTDLAKSKNATNAGNNSDFNNISPQNLSLAPSKDILDLPVNSDIKICEKRIKNESVSNTEVNDIDIKDENSAKNITHIVPGKFTDLPVYTSTDVANSEDSTKAGNRSDFNNVSTQNLSLSHSKDISELPVNSDMNICEEILINDNVSNTEVNGIDVKDENSAKNVTDIVPGRCTDLPMCTNVAKSEDSTKAGNKSDFNDVSPQNLSLSHSKDISELPVNSDMNICEEILINDNVSNTEVNGIDVKDENSAKNFTDIVPGRCTDLPMCTNVAKSEDSTKAGNKSDFNNVSPQNLSLSHSKDISELPVNSDMNICEEILINDNVSNTEVNGIDVKDENSAKNFTDTVQHKEEKMKDITLVTCENENCNNLDSAIENEIECKENCVEKIKDLVVNEDAKSENAVFGNSESNNVDTILPQVEHEITCNEKNREIIFEAIDFNFDSKIHEEINKEMAKSLQTINNSSKTLEKNVDNELPREYFCEIPQNNKGIDENAESLNEKVKNDNGNKNTKIVIPEINKMLPMDVPLPTDSEFDKETVDFCDANEIKVNKISESLEINANKDLDKLPYLLETPIEKIGDKTINQQSNLSHCKPDSTLKNTDVKCVNHTVACNKTFDNNSSFEVIEKDQEVNESIVPKSEEGQSNNTTILSKSNADDIVIDDKPETFSNNSFQPSQYDETFQLYINESKSKNEPSSPCDTNSNFEKLDVEEFSNIEQLSNPFKTKNKIQTSPPLSPVMSNKGYNINFDDIEDPFATKTKIRQSPTPETSGQVALISEDNKSRKVSPKVNKSEKRKSYPIRKPMNAKKNSLNATFDCDNKKECKANVEDSDKIEINTKKEETIDSFKADTSGLSNTVINSTSKPDLDNKTICLIDNKIEAIEEGHLFSKPTNPTPARDITKSVYNCPEINDLNFSSITDKQKTISSNSTTLSGDTTFDHEDCPKAKIDSQDSICPEAINDQEVALVDGETSVSKDSKSSDIKEVNTEDEDTATFNETIEFIENDKENPNTEKDLLAFEVSHTALDNENIDNGEMFIDAEAFEFLLNQNQSNVIADSGKESLFLKFDPLFTKRVSSDGIIAALKKVQNNQSTPKKLTKLQLQTPLEMPGPSQKETVDDVIDDASIQALSKPMMVVNPAINSIVSPRKAATPKVNRQSLTFTSPAMAVIDKLLSLSGSSLVADHNTPVSSPVRQHNETDIAITQLREMLADKDIHVHNLKSESKELKDRLSSLEAQVKSLEVESAERLKKVKDLNERLLEKTKINKSMSNVVEEYERTIASLIAQIEQEKKNNAEERIMLIKERDEQTAHLTSMEVSFNDLHSKYEKSKQLIYSMKANEETYKKSIQEFEESLTKMQNNYELLKQHATSKLNHANLELEKFNRAHESEVLKLNALIKRKELHITSLEETLAQKTKANEELTAICDELINKVG